MVVTIQHSKPRAIGTTAGGGVHDLVRAGSDGRSRPGAPGARCRIARDGLDHSARGATRRRGGAASCSPATVIT